jgi:hypothetical protein
MPATQNAKKNEFCGKKNVNYFYKYYSDFSKLLGKSEII